MKRLHLSAHTVCIVALLQFFPAPSLRAQSFPRFTDVARDIGVTLPEPSPGREEDYIVEVNGNGAAFFDYDSDDDLDLLIVRGSTLESYADGGDPMAVLYENRSGSFVEVTREAGLSSAGWGMGACVADYDNDGHQDLYLTAYGPNVLYRNMGDGTFDDVTATAGVGDTGWSMNCAYGDYDQDGDVDLYVSNYLSFDDSVPARGETDGCLYMGQDVMCGPLGLAAEPDSLYRNNGDGSFSNVSEAAGITDRGHFGFGVVFSDFDADGWPDIYVANDSVPNLMYHNNQDGTFSEIGLLSATSHSAGGRAQAGMGLGVGDYDNDGDIDIFVTNFAQDTNTLYQNSGDMVFNDVTALSGLGQASLPHLGWGTTFQDFDNDGWLDMFVANGHVYRIVDDLDLRQSFRQPKEIYRNIGGAFEEVLTPAGEDPLDPKSARGAAFGDYDGDGDVDAVVINIDDAPSFYRNDGGNRNHWISFRLEGASGNRDAIGARIAIDVSGRTQVREIRSGGSYLSHNDMRAHFGLGEANRVDGIRIWWSNGNTEEFAGVDADQFLHIREGSGTVTPLP